MFAFFDAVRKRHVIIVSNNISQLGRNLEPFWRPLDFKGVPKSTVFAIENIDVQEEGLNKHSLMPKWEARNCLKQHFALYLFAIKKICGQENWSNVIKIEALSIQSRNFWDFDRFWQPCFFDVLESWQKAGQQISFLWKSNPSWLQIIIQFGTHSLIWQRLAPASVGGFGRPLDFEGVQTSTIFRANQNKMRKMKSRNGIWKQWFIYLILM